jgi:hypothetical protein
MLHMLFELRDSEIDGTSVVSGYAQGYLTVEGTASRCSSKDRVPPQSMMVFLAIVDLLDGLHRLQTPDDEKRYVFVGTDSSFQVQFEKLAGDRLRINCGKIFVGDYSVREVMTSVLHDVDHFLSEVPRPDNPAAGDLESALSRFRLWQ